MEYLQQGLGTVQAGAWIGGPGTAAFGRTFSPGAAAYCLYLDEDG